MIYSQKMKDIITTQQRFKLALALALKLKR
jgi:hypothetical protein